MQALTLFMIVVVTTAEFFSAGDKWGRWAFLPGWSPYLAELSAAVAAVVVVFAGARGGFRFVRSAYWIVFGALLLTIIAGAVINSVAAGPIFAGIRTYLRAIPWFLLPAVVTFSDSQIRTQLLLLTAIAIVQVPFSLQQTVTAVDLGKITGDWTVGTLMLSPTLSIFLICAMCVLCAFLARRRINLKQFILLFVLFLLPTTINETKATFFLLPVGLFIAFLFASRPGQRFRYAASAIGVVAVAAAIFVPIYDGLISKREYAVPLTDFLTDPARLERYMTKTDDIGVIGGQQVGRLDSVYVPLRRLSSDPTHLAFGYGIGNASHSALGHGFTGRYYQLFGPFLVTAFSRLVLELGLLGLAGVLSLVWMIFMDCHVVSQRRDDLMATLAAGWAGALTVVTVCIVYTDVISPNSLSFLFWYMSGLIAAARMRSHAE